jgi:uncharacterized protein DUF5047
MAFPVSGLFLDALRGGQYQNVVTADLYYSGNFIATLPVTAGSISIDRTAHVRRSCSVTIGSPSFIPLFAGSSLSPYGSEIRIFMGIQYPAGNVELVPMGIFEIYSIAWTDGDGSIPTVTGYDYGKRIDDAVFAHSVDRSGRDAFSILEQMIDNIVFADVIIDDTLENYTLPGGSVFDDNRWDCIQKVLDPMGAEAFFDVQGNFIVQPVPSVTSATTDDDISWTVDCGPTGVLVSANRTVTREGCYNFVTAMGSSTTDTGAPPVGYAADTDPTSPTYWGPASSVPDGPFIFTPFGFVTLRYQNDAMTTSAQCTAAAKAQLAQVLGVQRSLDFTSAPNPTLDGGDIIKVVYQDGSSEYHLLDTISVDLNAGSFSANTRSKTVVLPAE